MRWNCSRGTHREGGLEFSQAYRSIPDGHRTNGKTGTLGIPVRDASYDESGSSIPGRLLSSKACFRFLDLLNVPKTPPQSVTDVVRTLCNACHETKQLKLCPDACPHGGYEVARVAEFRNGAANGVESHPLQ